MSFYPEDYTVVEAVVEMDFSNLWVSENPKRAIQAVANFYFQHPSDEWNVIVKDAYMPGMSITLQAKKRK